MQPNSEILESQVVSGFKDNFNDVLNVKSSVMSKSSSIISLNNKENSKLSVGNNSVSNLLPPLLPPPPPPPPAPFPLQPPTASPPLPPPSVDTLPDVVKIQECSKNLITIKIEDARLVEQLALKHRCDKAKIACALIIAGNDMNFANEILKMSKPL